MNKTFNINLGGYPFAIDEDAFNYIKEYLSRIRNHFSSSDGCEEILYDIEVRMAELFQEHLKGRAIISMKEIDEVIMIMGKPEDFGAEPMTDSFTQSNRSKKSNAHINTGKRLFRDPDDKKLGGVCAGIAAYFGIEDPLWLRIIFVMLTIFSGGFILFIYILLWTLVPEAASAGDKLAMRGEPTTINNIAKVVEDELNELSSKLNDWGQEIGGKKKSGGDQSRFYAKDVLSSGVNTFGHILSSIIPVVKNILMPLVKGIAMVVLAVLAFAWGAAFLGITIGSDEIMAFGPKSNFLNNLGFGSLYFSIGIPILGMILLIVRMFFGYRTHKNFRTGMALAWSLSWCITILVAVSTIKEYRSREEKKSTSFYNINEDIINISMPEESIDHSFEINLSEFFVDNGNKLSVKDVDFSIEKSKDNLLHIEKNVSARGSSSSEAISNMTLVDNQIKVVDNNISISKFYSIPKGQKFRDQDINYVIYVPEGKKIKISESVKPNIQASSLFDWDKIWAEQKDIVWTVTKDGLFSSDYEDKINHIKKLDIQSFSKVFVDKGFKLIIGQSDTPSVTISGAKELVDLIDYKNIGGILSISSKTDEDFEDVSIVIMSKDIKTIQLENILDAKIEGFDQGQLTLVSKTDRSDTALSFTGNIKDFNITLDGDQDVSLLGNGEFMTLKLTSGADIKADKFLTKTVKLYGSDMNDSSLNVSENLKCEDPEFLNISIIGNPKIEKLEKQIF